MYWPGVIQPASDNVLVMSGKGDRKFQFGGFRGIASLSAPLKNANCAKIGANLFPSDIHDVNNPHTSEYKIKPQVPGSASWIILTSGK
jgi:hypothetical protein